MKRAREPRAPVSPRPPASPTLSHVDAATGEARMVDVSAKPVTAREAVARGHIRISREAMQLVRAGAIKKGDPMQVARFAGILGAKQTAALIPLCHPLPLSGIDVTLTPRADGIEIEARVRTNAQTGVEMEALTAVAIAGLTIYDMVKAADKTMTLGDIRLIEKRGGRSGEYRAPDASVRTPAPVPAAAPASVPASARASTKAAARAAARAASRARR